MPARGNGAYSFLNVSAAIVGPGIQTTVTGAAREGYSAAYDADKSSFTVGADGSGMFSLMASQAGKMTFRLLKNSPTNRIFNTMYRYQTGSAAVFGRNTIAITDNNLQDIVIGYGGGIVKHSSIGYGEEGPTNEWVFQFTQLEFVLGDGGVYTLTSNGQ